MTVLNQKTPPEALDTPDILRVYASTGTRVSLSAEYATAIARHIEALENSAIAARHRAWIAEGSLSRYEMRFVRWCVVGLVICCVLEVAL